MLCLAVMALAAAVTAKPQFVARIPNGANVPGVEAVGHIDPAGGGARNAFGSDFSSKGLTWNVALCKLDSDGDGATNGEELLDPCCKWTPGATLASTSIPTHPGVKNTFTAAQLAALKCGAAASGTGANSTAGATPSPGATTADASSTSGAPTAPATTAALPTVKSGVASFAVGAGTIVPWQSRRAIDEV
uniref:Secreted protein n=1 Tax=Achlya hypogyna TaxID=1202772 RepID=A0A0A7CPP7_ACHHY|nr:secreted protein [Achlya hypogyna]